MRVVRRAHDVGLELIAKNHRVAALGTSRHGLADPREGLMPIESAKLDDLAVELEAVVGEQGLPKGEAAGIFVDDLRRAAQTNAR